MTLEQLKSECESMQAELETVLPTEINEAIERATILSVYYARSGKMLADAKLLLRKKKASEISEMIIKIAKESFLSAKAQNSLVDSIAQDEAYLVDWIDRINAACNHQVELLRSIVSKEKEELRLSGQMGGMNRV